MVYLQVFPYETHIHIIVSFNGPFDDMRTCYMRKIIVWLQDCPYETLVITLSIAEGATYIFMSAVMNMISN